MKWQAAMAATAALLVTTGAQAQAPAPADDGQKDHDRFVGHIGASWFGVSSVPIATGSPGGTIDDPAVNPGPAASVSVPALGIRYWITRVIGIDAGLGFSVSSGSVRATTTAVDKQTVFGMLFHVGMPISLASGKHISLQLTPEANFGFAMSEVEPAPQPEAPPNAELSGTRFDIGARIGGEVHFGFIDIPELSLEGSIGAFFTHQSTTVSVGEAYLTDSNILFTTANFTNPWDFFTSVVAARYYF